MDDSLTGTPAPAGSRLVLGVLCFCSFASLASTQVVGPLLGAISQEFDVSIPLAGQLVTAYALPAAVISLVLGPLSDRYGRGWLLLAGLLVLAAASAASALAGSFAALLVCRALAGLGAAAIMPTTFGAVGDLFPQQQRGRAIALIVSANTLAGMAGVPLGALLAEITDWRWTLAAMALPLLLAAAVLWWRFPPARPRAVPGAGSYLGGYRAVLRDPGALPVLLAWLLSSTTWFAWQTYVGPFFQFTWGLSTGALGAIVAIMSVGILVGTNLGGRLGDAHGKPRIAVACLLLVGAMTAVVTTLVHELWVAVLLNFLLCIPNAGRFTTIAALATERAPGGRGTMLAVGAAAGQFAQIVGAGLGGVVVDLWQYAGLGVVGGALCWAAALPLARLPPSPPVLGATGEQDAAPSRAL